MFIATFTMSQKLNNRLRWRAVLVVLQNMALRENYRDLAAKTQVIYQSAEPVRAQSNPATDGIFNVCVVGHLRDEKDPLRAAMAVRNLPAQSRIQVTHIGLALDRRAGERGKARSQTQPALSLDRPTFARETPPTYSAQSRRLHHIEDGRKLQCVVGGPGIGVPVVATKISGLMGTLGKRFPGYFPVGDTKRLKDCFKSGERRPNFTVA